MISKVIIGRTFYGACRYICMNDKRAMVLETEGVRGHNYKLLAADFEMQQVFRPSFKKAVFHGILSFYPGEKIGDDKMVQIAKEYLQKLGIVGTQYSITKHTDRPHPHLHIIANLVNNKGETIKDNGIGLRGKKVSQKLTLKYGLKQALSKNLAVTHLERLNEKEVNRYVIYQAITEKLRLSKSLDDLRQQLQKQGIEALYKYKSGTNEIQGISFKIGEYKYKGSEIDSLFSVKNLERTMQQQTKQQFEQTHNVSMHQQPIHKLDTFFGKHKEVNLLHILEQSIKPEQSEEQLPYQWKIQRKHKKKKQSRRLNL